MKNESVVLQWLCADALHISVRIGFTEDKDSVCVRQILAGMNPAWTR